MLIYLLIMAISCGTLFTQQITSENFLPLIILPNSNDSTIHDQALNAVGGTLLQALLYHNAPIITTLSLFQELLSYRELLNFIHEKNFKEIIKSRLPNSQIAKHIDQDFFEILKITKEFVDLVEYLATKNSQSTVELLFLTYSLKTGVALADLLPGTTEEKANLFKKLPIMSKNPEIVKNYIETSYNQERDLPKAIVAQTYFFPLYFLLQPNLWHYYLIAQEDTNSDAMILIVPKYPNITEEIALKNFGLSNSIQKQKITYQEVLKKNALISIENEKRLAKKLIGWLKTNLKAKLIYNNFNSQYSWIVFITGHGYYDKANNIIRPIIGIFHEKDASDFLSIFEQYSMRLLYLNSCFMSDEALPAILGEESIFIKAHSYPIINTILTAAPAAQARPFFLLQDFDFIKLETGEIVINNVTKKKDIFKDFFNLVHQDPIHFEKIIDIFHLQKLISGMIQYNPTIKLPNTQWFIPINSTLAPITKVMASTQELKSYKPSVKKINKMGQITYEEPLAILLYTGYVPFPLIVPNKTQGIVSMLPGNAIHILNEVQFEGTKTIDDIFNCFASIIELKPEKIFFIKKLIWQEKQTMKEAPTQRKWYNVLVVTGNYGIQHEPPFISLINEQGTEINFEKNWTKNELYQVRTVTRKNILRLLKK